MTLELIEGEYAVCQVPDFSRLDLSADCLFLAKTDQECSIVCRTESVPANHTKTEPGWRAFRIAGQLDEPLPFSARQAFYLRGDSHMAEKTVLQTERTMLRPWQATDAAALYKYASDPRIGPAAGWPAHTSVENSRQIIQDVLSADETYAIVLKGETEPVGSIGLAIQQKDGRDLGEKGGEIGYWIGVPYWGQGIVPEAVRELLRRGFADLGLDIIWCGYYDGNDKSRKVMEKCGFQYHHTVPDKPCPLLNEIRIEHYYCMTREQWQDRALRR